MQAVVFRCSHVHCTCQSRAACVQGDMHFLLCLENGWDPETFWSGKKEVRVPGGNVSECGREPICTHEHNLSRNQEKNPSNPNSRSRSVLWLQVRKSQKVYFSLFCPQPSFSLSLFLVQMLVLVVEIQARREQLYLTGQHSLHCWQRLSHGTF